MASHSAGTAIEVRCVAAEALPAGFAAEFCAVLADELARNHTPASPPPTLEIALARTGEFGLSARISVLHAAAETRAETFQLSVRDGTLRPSIARTLLLPALKMLE